jgi:2-keto-myo-inositol isomerase
MMVVNCFGTLNLHMLRRKALQLAAASAASVLIPTTNFAHESSASNDHETPDKPKPATFTLSLNMATIRGHKLGFVKELETASKAGFRSVEIWMDSLQQFLDGGGTTQQARSIISDLGLTVENCIGFAEWIVDDEARRNKALEQLKGEMGLLSAINCKRVAAPPMGATQGDKLNLKAVAERYRAILELGVQTGVVPQLELWGFSTNLRQVSEVAYVAIESGHPSSKVLLDVYHLYKGESSLDTLHLVNTSGMEVFHVNDYPANIPPSEITDADRIYPTDGIAPLERILPLLQKTSKPLVLSFEVFNPNYYKQDPLLVAQTSLKKMKAAIDKVKKVS